MGIDKKILECELQYSKCFSEFYENEKVIRFRDSKLTDMYYHNYTYIDSSLEMDTLKHIIDNEITLRLSEECNYCNIILDDVVDNPLQVNDKYKAEVSTKGYYSFDISYFSKLAMIPDCIVKKVDNQKIIDDLLFCDLQHDEETLGKDFCTRRCYRRGEVYISDKGVDSYVCYHQGNIIGNCDLFIYEDIAKIEDFSVLPKYQRKGYGTTILKAVIDISIKENCKTIYLNTYEDDTAKEMYIKNGFYKIGESSDLFFKL